MYRALLRWLERSEDCEIAEWQRHLLKRLLADGHTMILGYMQALVLLCFSVLAIFSIALTALRLPYAFLLALLAFALEFVPLFGPLAAGAIIVAVCEFNHYGHVGSVLLFLVGYRIFQDYVLSPHLMEKSVQLPPLLIIFGVFAGGELGGIGGIFLSVPVLAAARLLFRELQSRAVPASAQKSPPTASTPLSSALELAENA